MKLYAIYKDGRRVKRYGVHKTKLKALYEYGKVGAPSYAFFYSSGIESLMRERGYSIQVMGETE